jgi:hypothetical protein
MFFDDTQVKVPSDIPVDIMQDPKHSFSVHGTTRINTYPRLQSQQLVLVTGSQSSVPGKVKAFLFSSVHTASSAYRQIFRGKR